MYTMTKKILLLCILLLSIQCKAQLYFPPISGNTWDTTSAQTLGWCTHYIDTLYDYLDTHKTKAFIVLKDGNIVLEKYFGTFTQDSIWYWASAGKTITSMLIGIAQQEGKLSIQDTTSMHLGAGWTACTALQENKITIRNQLTMTTGLDDGVPNNHCTLPGCLQYLALTNMRWAYHNAPYTLLDSVIEITTSQSLNNYASQKIKTPTGITGLFIKNNYDNVFYSKARSMARFGLLVLNKGIWNTTPILSDTTYYNQMTNTSQILNKSYGYLWWLNGKQNFMVPGAQLIFAGALLPNAPTDMIMALGKNAQIINVIPSKKMVLIRMGEAPFDNGEVPFTFNDSIWQYMNKILCAPNAVKNNTPQNTIQLFPNPCNNILYIHSKELIQQYQITDIYGSILAYKTPNSTNEIVELKKYNKGVYIIKITTSTKEVYIQKFSKE